ncbi:MAG: hypothetical protein K6F72_00190 [Bacteroidales bacterium]|nr:hypothetical protein [Bacteroidales bacterium]
MIITLNVSMAEVLRQVAQSSAYIGAKRQEQPKAEDSAALDRIETIDEDRNELECFFGEARVELVNLIAGKVVNEGFVVDNEPDHYVLELRVPDDFNSALLPVYELGLISYFVNSLLAAWLVYTHAEDMQLYGAAASAQAEKLHSLTIQRASERKMYPY